MKNIIRAVAISLGILVVLVVVNIFCNKTGHELDPLYTGTITPLIAMILFGGSSDKSEKNANV
ncbi:hypothetical protein [Butyrivibrio sp. VCD2006]|uniref:hypothetical protein n=1 Tax=Butyrivibrio sp. VCD2006 TaxID=1280664 RepID=UPI00040146F3|nr:hypothetical protein [Butyrivibrio sp. VCD2006]